MQHGTFLDAAVGVYEDRSVVAQRHSLEPETGLVPDRRITNERYIGHDEGREADSWLETLENGTATRSSIQLDAAGLHKRRNARNLALDKLGKLRRVVGARLQSQFQ